MNAAMAVGCALLQTENGIRVSPLFQAGLCTPALGSPLNVSTHFQYFPDFGLGHESAAGWAAYVSQALSAKKGQEGGLSIVGCHFYVIWKVSCGFRKGGHCSSQMIAGGSGVRLPAVSWNGKDLRERQV